MFLFTKKGSLLLLLGIGLLLGLVGESNSLKCINCEKPESGKYECKDPKECSSKSCYIARDWKTGTMEQGCSLIDIPLECRNETDHEDTSLVCRCDKDKCNVLSLVGLQDDGVTPIAEGGGGSGADGNSGGIKTPVFIIATAGTVLMTVYSPSRFV